ncbi:hypothetical protein PHMEG_0003523 [Phytophthora megakarya]|uniref:Uncharacterized protein n=1 Tax=Phytophthora megakarya TaxID=4795 RepID=A0A225WXT3_9STRA|nr:hypothetical protein PHMEG_0003523 [Phytophthora megakarya]
MIDTITTNPTNCTVPPRRRSRSEGSKKMATELQTLLEQSPLVSKEIISPFTCFSMTELYVKTSDGVVFQDENFQRETIAKAERLVETALSPDSSERNALIAKKALKYREMRSRRPNYRTTSDMALRTQSCPGPN